MFNIAHHQTTAYHPESNGAVERLHRRLKDALCGNLGRCATLHTGLSPDESVFGAPIVLPNEFLQSDELPVESIIKNFQKTLDAPAFSLPRHNCSSSLLSELLAELISARLVWVRCGDTVLPLYDSPFTVLSRGARSFTFRVGFRDEIVAVSRLKACTTMATTPGSPRRSADCRASAQAVPLRPNTQAARRGQAGVVLTPPGVSAFNCGAAAKQPWNRFPTQRGGFCTPGTGNAVTGSTAVATAAPAATAAVSATSADAAAKDGPLTSPSSRGQSSGGALLRPVSPRFCSGCTVAPLILFVYSVQFPAIKAFLCIEINECCHSCRLLFPH